MNSLVQPNLPEQNPHNSAAVPSKRPRPQRLHTWFNLMPVAEFEKKRPEKILFLDTFVTVTPKPDKSGYTVLFENKEPMVCVVHIGVIFVWYGENLQVPDRPFPKLYDKLFPTQYVTSKPVLFENTHVMDFVENGSDNMHFRGVHLWDYSKIYNHVVTPDKITLEQDTRFHYGSCSFNPFIRFMSRFFALELHHDYAYHGPCLAVVNADGMGSPEFHALVSLTPEGEDRTRVYVTMALSPDTISPWLEKPFKLLSPNRSLVDLLALLMANYIQNEFDVDRVIWNKRKILATNKFLPNEKHMQNVIDWGKTFYPKNFVPPVEKIKLVEEKSWHLLDAVKSIPQGKIKSYTVAGEQLVAYKDSKGEVHVLDAYCPHQGAHLGFGGRIENDCVRCPFHGFYFDGKGECRGANIDNTTKPIEELKLVDIAWQLEGDSIKVFV